MIPAIERNWLEYKLTAEHDGETESAIVDVSLVEETQAKMIRYIGTDGVAVMNASFVIMSKASDSDIWAKGEITLTSPDGRVIETMAAK